MSEIMSGIPFTPLNRGKPPFGVGTGNIATQVALIEMFLSQATFLL